MIYVNALWNIHIWKMCVVYAILKKMRILGE